MGPMREILTLNFRAEDEQEARVEACEWALHEPAIANMHIRSIAQSPRNPAIWMVACEIRWRTITGWLGIPDYAARND